MNTLSRSLGTLALICTILLSAPAGAAPATRPAADTEFSGKVMAGYQGWFAPEIPGTPIKWIHFGHGHKFEPGISAIDLWPDTTGFDPDERIPTGFKHADGSVAHVFSSANPKTVDRHFQWMKEYGLDGVYLQRFGVTLGSRQVAQHQRKVLDNVRASAQRHGRLLSIMYDLSGLRKGQIQSLVIEDFKRLKKEQAVLSDPTYLTHNGKPVIAVWGVGFNDNRDYTLEECRELVKFLKSDPTCGGNAVLLGVPYYWRELKNDTIKDPLLHQIIEMADIVSPWAVGRYAKPQQIEKNQKSILEPDARWLAEKKIAYLPVIFPGFSWHNLMKLRGKEAPLNAIPRLKGQFLWSQAMAAKKAGINGLYIAMFDEIDEGTAIMKVTSDPPVGASPFATYEGLPSDHYLWLTGRIKDMLLGKIPATPEPPVREGTSK